MQPAIGDDAFRGTVRQEFRQTIKVDQHRFSFAVNGCPTPAFSAQLLDL